MSECQQSIASGGSGGETPRPSTASRGAAAARQFSVNDRVTWAMRAGGYGLVLPVPAVVRKIGTRRVQIEVAQRINGQWVRATKKVLPDRLSPRTGHVPELDDRLPAQTGTPPRSTVP